MIKKHSIIWFYIFTLVFTLILGGVSQALCINLIPKDCQTILSLMIIQMAPSLSTIFIVLWVKDGDFFKNMNWWPTKNIISVLWFLLSFIIPLVIIVIASAVMSVYGKAYIPNSYSIKLLIVTAIGTLFGCVGEEIGWRGFMQPSFNRKYPLFSSATFTGILWGIWHFGKIASFGILGYLLFILLITEFSVIMAWIYSKSNRNMICMVAFHFGVNISSLLLLTGREGIMFYTVAIAVSTPVCLMLVLADRKKFNTKL